MMINIITLYSKGKAIKNCRAKNDDFYCKGREGGGQRVMIEIILSENDDNDGQPLRRKNVLKEHFAYRILRLHLTGPY